MQCRRLDFSGRCAVGLGLSDGTATAAPGQGAEPHAQPGGAGAGAHRELGVQAPLADLQGELHLSHFLAMARNSSLR